MFSPDDQFLRDDRFLTLHLIPVMFLHQIFILTEITDPTELIFFRVDPFLTKMLATEIVLTKFTEYMNRNTIIWPFNRDGPYKFYRFSIIRSFLARYCHPLRWLFSGRYLLMGMVKILWERIERLHFSFFFIFLHDNGNIYWFIVTIWSVSWLL